MSLVIRLVKSLLQNHLKEMLQRQMSSFLILLILLEKTCWLVRFSFVLLHFFKIRAPVCKFKTVTMLCTEGYVLSVTVLGYSTKVYFNICCKPSPLFDPDKVLSDLPFSLGPGYIAETTQTVLQLLVNLCKDPVAGLDQLPCGNGVSLVATSSDGLVTTSEFDVPCKLSTYWSMLYHCASVLGCCENFLSASPPSAPCLLCHPYG